jgi:hypothetical protein
LRPDPEFEVLRPVVISHTVAVMDLFVGEEVPPQYLLHDEDVFEHIAATPCPRVVRESDHEIASLVSRATAPPVPVELELY